MIQIVPYQKHHDKGIRELCRIPVSGNISLALERESCYLDGAQVQCEQAEIYVAYEEAIDKVWAVINMGWRKLWYQNNIENVRYLSDLRIHPDKQKSTLLFSLIKKFNSQNQNKSLPAQTVVFADNSKMLQYIARLAQQKVPTSLPVYHKIGQLNTYLINFKTNAFHSKKIIIRTAKTNDIQLMQEFLNTEGPKINFFPYYDFKNLESPYFLGMSIDNFYLAFENDQLSGMCSVWNQIQFKQTKIVAYSKFYEKIKPLYNLVSHLFGNNKLPPPNTALNYGYLHSILIKNRVPYLFGSMLQYIRYDQRNNGFDYLMCSLHDNDPLSRMMEKRGYVRKIKGYYYLVNDGHPIPETFTNSFFYLEGARI
jgi:hypothetical protein